METDDKIPALIEMLEAMRKYPQMYAGELTVNAVWTFIIGLRCGLSFFGYTPHYGSYWAISEERGWAPNSSGPQKPMRDAGWNEEASVDELLLIEIETWKRTLIKRNELKRK